MKKFLIYQFPTSAGLQNQKGALRQGQGLFCQRGPREGPGLLQPSYCLQVYCIKKTKFYDTHERRPWGSNS